ncbi:hypothetical protein K504DRAFT_284951 [Pleomassaria siparia CBS 279.74]|uniref:Uncharacterized protein n=1 Tax=Pleomassaria siparia CBS 279.74 TaxID=1314801 RepID=A0A6G1K6Y0_9PLEO|nr:hypothetical protein K504DRAFT_284951 [Pleomassaria siparia CBS 279.74]
MIKLLASYLAPILTSISTSLRRWLSSTCGTRFQSTTNTTRKTSRYSASIHTPKLCHNMCNKLPRRQLRPQFPRLLGVTKTRQACPISSST